MNTDSKIADAEADIAALVYSNHDRPDLVQCAFAERLAVAGRRLCGLVQLRDPRHVGSPSRIVVFDSRRMVEVTHDHDPAGSQCRLDPHWLNQMGRQAEATIRQGIDAVIVNRFGPLEAAGQGFRNAILAASETKTPLIVAVPEFEFERWTQFSAGMAVKLDCTLDSVVSWWHKVCAAPTSMFSPVRSACERFK